MADAMNENRLLNVAVEQSPTFSLSPYRPKPIVDLALGGFTAMFLASFLVFFAEMGRGTIATGVEIERMSVFPVLATVPMDRRLRGSKTGWMGDSGPVFIGLESIYSPTSAYTPSTEERARALAPRLMRYRKESRAI
jgi:hypothetical protein